MTNNTQITADVKEFLTMAGYEEILRPTLEETRTAFKDFLSKSQYRDQWDMRAAAALGVEA